MNICINILDWIGNLPITPSVTLLRLSIFVSKLSDVTDFTKTLSFKMELFFGLDRNLARGGPFVIPDLLVVRI